MKMKTKPISERKLRPDGLYLITVTPEALFALNDLIEIATKEVGFEITRNQAIIHIRNKLKQNAQL